MDIRGRKMRKPPACVQCRRRKVGCDRVKPVCGNCSRNGKNDCFYPDVPGQYVQSNSQIQAAAASAAAALNGNGMMANSGDLSSIDQIREYNTRLQLLNSEGKEIPEGPRQYVPRTTTFPSTKQVPSTSNLKTNLNWVQGPAIFTNENTGYGQDEAVLKELDFLKGRIIELRQVIGKGVDDIDLEWSVNPKVNEIKKNEDEFVKKRRLESENSINTNLLEEHIDELNEYRDVDPNFLDEKEIFDILECSDYDSSRKEIMGYLRNNSKNSLFSSCSIFAMDPFLYNQFLKRIDSNIAEKYANKFKTWKEKKMEGKQFKKDDILVKLPDKTHTKDIIGMYNNIVIEAASLIPVLNGYNLVELVDRLFAMGSTFDVTKLPLAQLFRLGEINMCLLLCYQSIISSVLLTLKDEMNNLFSELQAMVPTLESNMFTIKSQIERREDSENRLDYVKFISLWKLYSTISATFSDAVDNDEDANLGILFGISHEHSNSTNMLLWNFIEKNYQFRHLLRGEIPVLTLSTSLNTAYVRDPVYDADKSLLLTEAEVVKYLLSTDEKLSIEKVKYHRDDLKMQHANCMRNCTTVAMNINSVNDTVINKNLLIFISYLLMLQYEKITDLENYKLNYLEFIRITQETIFYIFSNLAQVKFTGHEFLYVNNFFKVLENIAFMYLGGYERSEREYSELDDENSKRENRFHSGLCFLILQKLHMLVRDYSKNCRVVNLQATKLLTTLETILSHRFEPVDVSRPNIFKSISNDTLRTFNTKLYQLSEALVKKEFYEGGIKYDPKNWDSIGITDENIVNVLEAFYAIN